MNISILERQIETAENALAEKKKNLDESDRFQIASLNSFSEHIKTLRKQLYDLQIRREKEILEVRFIGNKAHNGSLPLMLHSILSKGLAESLITISTKVRKPKKNAEYINQTELDLRLANIVSGSTKFILTLEIEPDIFGWSLSQNTLNQWFQFFSSLDDPENNSDAISFMGLKGISSIKTMLSALKKNNLDFELCWNSHQDKKYYWMGNSQKIESAINFLNNLKIEKPVECIISGIVQNLDRSGKITLIDEDRKNYKVRLDKSVLTEIEKLRINQFIALRVIKNVSTHPTFERVLEHYDFIEVV
ncbi:hypothetical protein ACS72_08115 [Acinetobacter sp. VT 511]|uniref:hypothetical protein n=1 Tax=Acinetobacter sp. VT 511 TaxID=1675902 RepID=UPI000661FB86|nr:hypothetical protein [Acinetobacter sp. VT 511]KMU99813.1 hypothetical protein ACS72_08115 [Acinetobacter sp. VT 511]